MMQTKNSQSQEPQQPSIADPARLKRIKYRAWHRGFKEADLLLGPFADAQCDMMSEEELSAFEALLAVPDQELYDWALGLVPCPAEHQGPVMDALQARVRAGGLAAGR